MSTFISYSGGDTTATIIQGTTNINVFNLENYYYSTPITTSTETTGHLVFAEFQTNAIEHLGVDPKSKFDLHLQFKSLTGHTASESIVGILLTSREAGFSTADLGRSVCYKFVAEKVAVFHDTTEN